MEKEEIKRILQQFKSGQMEIKEVLDKLKHFPYDDLGFAKIDSQRQLRKGFPEVIFELMGNRVERLYDVGVAGLHRLLINSNKLLAANVLIVVAGMEGALPSVVGGLVDKPIIAVPTSVGYGASFGGITALLAMLNSCASGVSVVNINNGFGAGYMASLINRL